MIAPGDSTFVADYGFVADLASACGWRLGLSRIERGRRFFLRVWSDGEYLAGVKFPTGGSIDRAASVLFDVLTERGHV